MCVCVFVHNQTRICLTHTKAYIKQSVFKNINAIHEHLQTTFPKKMIMPEFWCEECPDGALILYYHSRRGNAIFAPIAMGLVTELARFRFELDIDMDRLSTQSVDGAKFTR